MTEQTQTFGEMVADLRLERKLKQEELARRVSEAQSTTVGASTISRIEQGQVSISDRLGRALIRALKPRADLKNKMVAALETYMEGFELATPWQRSGKVFGDIMEEAGITYRYLAAQIDKSFQVVSAWRDGISAIPDDKLKAIRGILRDAGVPAARLDDLYSAHAKDTLRNRPVLGYLTGAQKKKLEAFIDDLF